MTALLDTAQIATMLSLKREYVTDRLTKRPDFPKPRLALNQKTKRWAEADIREWMERHRQPA